MLVNLYIHDSCGLGSRTSSWLDYYVLNVVFVIVCIDTRFSPFSRRLMIFFFFQAEDGIRDSSVTGVQTCALPIYARRRRARDFARDADQQDQAVQHQCLSLSLPSRHRRSRAANPTQCPAAPAAGDRKSVV